MRGSWPFRPPAAFERYRESTMRTIFETGTSAAQRFVLADAVGELERRTAADAGVAHAVACANATGALALALDSWSIGPSDEVIIPAYGCQSVVDTVTNLGATPVFADVDQRTFCIDPVTVAAAITPRTAAILPAHVFAMMADMPALGAIARRHALRILEDAAMAQGAILGGRPAGAWGDAGVYSFSQFKPFGAIGEGGIILTDDDETAARCRQLRQTVPGDSNQFALMGRHSRMDEILARFLLGRRPDLDRSLQIKRQVSMSYDRRLRPLAERGLLTLAPMSDTERWCHVYAILTDQRNELRSHLASRGVGSHVYYPVILPQQPAFADPLHGASFPHAEAVARQNLALPLWPGLTEDDLEHITESVLEFFRLHSSPRRHLAIEEPDREDAGMDLDRVGKVRWNETYEISENPSLWGDPPVPFVHTATDTFAADNAHTVLDLPVGDGRNVLPLAARFPAVVGGDSSENALDLCASRLQAAGVGNVLLQEVDIFKTSFLDDSFDGIFCCEALGHLQNPVDALREMLRICRPGKQVITNLFADDEPIRQDPAIAPIDGGDYRFRERIFFRFYDEAAAREVAKRIEHLANLVSIEHVDWVDPPHEGYRNYEHGHASWLLALRKRD